MTPRRTDSVRRAAPGPLLLGFLLLAVMLGAACATHVTAPPTPTDAPSATASPAPASPSDEPSPTAVEPSPSEAPSPSAGPTHPPGPTHVPTPTPTPYPFLYVPESPAYERNGIAAAALPDVYLPDDRSWIPAGGLEATAGWIGKVAYLTIDDGPSVSRTLPYLSILQAYGIHATFFLIGSHLNYGVNEAIVLRELEQGHALQNHTYSHGGSYASFDVFKSSVLRGMDAICSLTGATADVLRYPGGSNAYAALPLARDTIPWLASKGIKYVDWNTSTGDGNNVKFYSADQLAFNALAYANKQNLYVLMHDLGYTAGKPHHDSVRALPLLIKGLYERGYRFAVVTASSPMHHFALKLPAPTPTAAPTAPVVTEVPTP